MADQQLPPPPINDKPGSFTWMEWYRQLRNYVSTSGSIPWYVINFAGSNITDIAQRAHNDLQTVQGGTAGERYHLTAAQHTLATAYLHNSLNSLQGGNSTERYHLDAAEHTNLTSDNPGFDSITLSNVSGNGIMLDKDTPAFGWKDLIGDTVPKTAGAGSPSLTTFINDVRWFAYTATDDGDIIFHIPHDYAPGTDVFVHIHWAHIGTNITGDLDIRFHLTYAKGHNQAIFPADVEPHLTMTGLNITDFPQYQHNLEEIQISASSPSATQIDTDLLEPDGIIMMHYDVDTLPTISGGGSNRMFIFAIDLHYQATNITTKNKVPDFYA